MSTGAVTAAPPGLAPAGRRLDLPRRARDLQLLGELAGSGYRETPTLVRRGDGQLIKLTPLLYELVDAIDGRRGREGLATELGRRVRKHVTTEDIEFLIEHKLRPLGLLREPDGDEPALARANPLLVLRPRFIISKPALTQTVTAPFVWLFSPLATVPLVLAFVAVAAWLLTGKGLSSALHQALYEPWLLLVVWALVVLSAAFHEIGHAAACRYGGGKPGSIGGGLYLIWPAFYTEVSDAYRLSRGARIRVDLGGLYFSAIFAVATTALWRLTGADALLLVIAVQLIQMVRQLPPFIRADGYHILADLVGVPDLFTHIKPTLMSALPGRRWRVQGPGLKPWACAVVTAWVLITVPVLVGVLAMLVLVFPRIVGTAWDSVGLRWAETATYWSTGDIPGAVTSAISLGLVALPVLGITYLLSRVVRRVAVRTWRGTGGRPLLRALSVLAASALVALVAWAWWPAGENYRPISANEQGPLAMLDALAPAEPPATSEPMAPLLVAPTAAALPAASALALQPVPGGYLLVTPVLPPAVDDALPPGFRPGAPAGDDLTSPLESDPGDPTLGPGDGVSDDPDGSPTWSFPSVPRAPTDPDGTAWVFPFDPPLPTEPGDNRAMAVNTTDGSMLWDFAFSVLLLEGEESVEQVNDAHAYASCTACVTGAVAFQVILIVDDVDTIIPENAAVAANYACVLCQTYAFAYQIVVTVPGLPEPATPDLVELGILDALDGLFAVDAASAASQQGEVSRSDTEAPPPESPQASASPTDSDEGGSAGQTDVETPASEADAQTPAGDADAESPPADGEMESPSEDTPAAETDGGGAGEVSTCGEAADAPAEGCPEEVSPAEDVAGESVTVP